MAPPKSQRALDFFWQGKGGKQRMEQDGSGSHSPTHTSDAGSDTDSRQVTTDDLSVSEKRLAAMLQDLRTSMKTDFQAAVSDMRKDTHEVGTRVNALEEKTDELCHMNDTIVEKIQRMEADNKRLMENLADLEDRSRHNNICVRGVPETVTQEELPAYLLRLFQAIQPSVELADLHLDRAHRVPKPQNLAHEVPRDIVTRLNYYSAKEAILMAQRKASAMQPTYECISLFADLSPTTMARRRDFINITKCLRNNKILYRWGFPTKLLIWRNGSLIKIEDPALGMDKLKTWGLFPDNKAPNAQASLKKVTADWSKA
ncbi:Hypothetical predicted protein [Pelobates cultripes]|uniref:L1 transposable element RRM domain-containing protein n=1 Tax=Pelobates cultripes TaxID=61616 RepID=A0AAD1WE30_PELCU|nr:Hypothetical predicted protein [Pelobates cultripes]